MQKSKTLNNFLITASTSKMPHIQTHKCTETHRLIYYQNKDYAQKMLGYAKAFNTERFSIVASTSDEKMEIKFAF